MKTATIVRLQLIALPLVIFFPVFHYGYCLLDDPEYVTANYIVQHGLSAASVAWAFTTFHFANWHPLTWLTLLADSTVYGPGNPGGFHATNLFFHIGAVLFLFEALRRMTKEIWPSAFVAAVFAVHPLHVQSVVWISERKGILSTFFGMLALLLWAIYIEKPSIGRYSATIAALALSLMSKQMWVTFPFLLLVLDYWPLRRYESHLFGRLLLEKSAFFALVPLFSAVAYFAQYAGEALHSQIDFEQRLANVVNVYADYVVRAFWPSNIAIFYIYPEKDATLAQFPISIAILTAVSVVVVWFWVEKPYLVAGWLWYLGTYVPVVGFVPIQGHGKADRWSDVPLVGIYIMVAWTIYELTNRFTVNKRVVAGLAYGSIAALAIVSSVEVKHWRSDEFLYKRAIEASPESYVGYAGLGEYYINSQRFSDAIEPIEKGLELNPNGSSLVANYAVCLAMTGRKKEAEENFKKAVKVAVSRNRSSIENSYAMFLVQEQRLDEALEHAKNAVNAKEDNIEALFNLGKIHGVRREIPEAIKAYETAIKWKPDFADAHAQLGAIYTIGRDKEKALKHLRIAVAIRPENELWQKMLVQVQALP